MTSNDPGLEHLTLGGGCFWCLEAVYQQLPGVTEVSSGYAGGDVEDPSYERVCNGSTGHAEVVRITFDPSLIGMETLLEVFWCIHDPTTLNRQGADVGTQYRSAIFYADEQQRAIAEQSVAEAQDAFDDPIVTEVAPLSRFWLAERYHQNYFRDNTMQPYCRAVVAPKLRKFQERFRELLNQEGAS